MTPASTPEPDTAVADAEARNRGGEYTQDSVQVLRDAAHIRKRPGNYIPDTGSRGLHHLVYELVYNSVDEALAGFCKTITVTIHLDGTLSVRDDGRGIPVEMHPGEGRPTLEVVLTTVGAGGKFDNNAYKVSAGLHGMGAKAVTALSAWTEAQVRRDGRTYVQEYEAGRAVTTVRDIGAADHTGTKITFRPDPEIFKDATFVYDTLEDRLRELAFLNRALRITLMDERTGQTESFFYEGGIGEYVAWMNRDDSPDHPPIYIHKVADRMQVEVALQYSQIEGDRVRAYANNAYNPSGGTHLSGFRAALTRTLNAYGEKENLFKGDLKPIGDDFSKGLTAVVSVQLAEPQFESQTKVRLNNPEVAGVVSSAVSEALSKYLEENPKDAGKIIRRAMLAAEEREAIAKAREALRKRKNILSNGGLPGKLMDCTSKGDDCELFLVEGDSAGGSAEGGRDRKFQAVLPLRGKPLNVEKAQLETMLKNEEIVSIISAIGIDIGNPEDVSKIRYGKIIILTDADVDGQHIRTLLLTFFFRQMRKLVEAGHIYVARPPLFKVVHKKQKQFVQTNEALHQALMERGRTGAVLEVGIEGEPRLITGETLNSLLAVLDELEHSLNVLERRGLSLAMFQPMLKDHTLPVFRVRLGAEEHWFYTSAEVDEFRKQKSAQLGRELIIADTLLSQFTQSGQSATGGDAGQKTATPATPASTPAPSADDDVQMYLQELQEIRGLNRALAKFAALGFAFEDLIPLQRIAGREPPIRYHLVNGEQRKAMPHLRVLTHEIRRMGEKGWAITRFKGLGEMDADELWDTTLDPSKRMLLQVSLVDAQKADDMFRVLMGDEVEGRRKFIFQHGIDLKELDYGGA
ncbi:DNA gyrase/topoisomerase IV subunit B [Tuwongella immobilis]|uniref:DNA topoisomerase (ATP-hydrolyzing) n=1 Tax=Tuwongella immobilis TaxID=692036 RepID=A0A6C2YIC9_9BACT|nr:DNA gyrase subunit B [Tuwongella immobilis]VIP01019.1 dna gyrase subunit b : DNA gyrase subunit B OS=Singulisphaera acidiphila (strain ATCC BAA-1392 / DSM 18658 / VKM B-2454 / MOB10) GN=gyrB PE=3 SV=1: HATPase_c: DNA_gyraseB: Toprim: DNA_gyraseB_C [Tuwongella immobilis]VTR97463.1 dna gyrase subunit b : DNA gyrase subunit B OS=Singulisphaera acidiphila (strain ATCC BAA-1392 / DSM 18658 / VKM B-2454 / MOB10) GN=gyrB PE=3 SV=1: HATPase_c: DNA_gyraseB: Toprim: DNA_gyraseB_C [Tuwongella immobilis]